MKYLISILLLMATPAAAQKQHLRFISDQYCTSYDDIMIEAAINFGESILFKGDAIQSHINGQYVTAPFVFSVNQSSGTWTLITLFDNDLACHVVGGINFEPHID